MKITDITENLATLTPSPETYAPMVQQAMTGRPTPTNTYQGLGQLRGTGAPNLGDKNPVMPMGAPPVPDQQPAEALPGTRDLPQTSAAPTPAFEAAAWTMTFRDFLALYETEKARNAD